ncbi:HTH-type transcriptional activator RhaS [bioreactor metagenome]|uniref:DNA-binding response regulator, AraC family n=2 Tax=root TaxID=1 RepID=A0A069D1F7_9BACE|nr:response regulator [Bacteroides graminisolvens]GAK36748.1 DNA-binding response regulator, AraC family [Bacteroides graminisolvens DSM 19988 = JCM 15093]
MVEDHEELREYLKSKFSAYFTVITATNGTEAMEAITRYLPEIVVSDVMMPHGDGLTLCQQIKDNSLFADIFVILLTAKSSTDDELQGYKAGADIYVKKPFDSDALLNQIININQTRQKRKSQLLGKLISPDSKEIEFDPKEHFLQQSMKIIEDHLMDADFKIDEFAAEMNTSKTVLHRKFRSLVGQTPNQFIRTIRLRKAVHLLGTSDLTIAEIAYLTGFNQSHYFIKCFREVYHDTPKNFRQKKQE